jgi:hypothetical protein
MAPVCIVRIGAFSWGSNGTMAETNIIDFEVKQMTRDEKRGGVLSITRRLLFDPVVADDPIAFKLWLWILGMARFRTGEGLKRGQVKASIEDIRQAARTAKGKGYILPSTMTIRRIVKRFVDAKWIETSRAGNCLLITVLKYDEYQRGGISEHSQAVISEHSRNPPQTHAHQGSAIYGKSLVNTLETVLVNTLDEKGENGSENRKKSIVKKFISEHSSNVPQTHAHQGSIERPETISEHSSISVSEHSPNGCSGLEPQGSTISENSLVNTRLNILGNGIANYIEKSESTNVASPKKLAAISADDVHALYLEMCPDLPRSKMTVGLRTVINARFKESKEQRTIAFWHWFFTYVSESDFLCGRVKSFKANLAWLVGPKNFSKIMAGQYENRDFVMPMPQTYREWLDYERRMMVADVFEDRFGKKGGQRWNTN